MLTFVDQADSRSRSGCAATRRGRPRSGECTQKGSLQVGTDADFTIVDPDREWTLADRTELHSKNCVTPFEGETFTGKAIATVVRGDVVAEDGAVVGESGYGTRVDID